jgi:hypothetical protein
MRSRDPPAGALYEEPGRLEADAHELIARAHVMLARAARLRAAQPASPTGADDLVPLSESGLGVRTRRRLEREGRLPVVKLGRQKFTRRSALLELVGEKDASDSATPEAKDPREAARTSYNRSLALVPSTGRR